MPEYKYELLTSDQQIETAKKDYKSKHDQIEQQFIDSKWQQTKVTNPNAFNGQKLVAYTKQGEQKVKLLPSDYASFVASMSKDKVEGVNLRPHFSSGVIIACKTSDNKIIVGSRDAMRKKDDPNSYLAQFPCGFIDVNDDFFKKFRHDQSGDIKKSQDRQSEFCAEIIGNAKRELMEEVLDFSNPEITGKKDSAITKLELLGSITDKKEWPTKKGGTKQIENIKSFVVLAEVDMKFDEIAQARAKYHPKDWHEMTIMSSIDVEKLGNRDDEVILEDKKRKFVAEHGVTVEVVKNYLQIKKAFKPSTTVIGALEVIINQLTGEKDSRGCIIS